MSAKVAFFSEFASVSRSGGPSKLNLFRTFVAVVIYVRVKVEFFSDFARLAVLEIGEN